MSQLPDLHWHLNKATTIAIITGLFGILGALLGVSAQGLWFASKLESRVTMLENERSSQRDRDDRQDAAAAHADAQQREQLKHLDAKVDKVLDLLTKR